MATASWGLPSDWGSGSYGQFRGGIGGLEQLSEAGPEFVVETGATDLEQEIGAAVLPVLTKLNLYLAPHAVNFHLSPSLTPDALTSVGKAKDGCS
jgi:hypothetical protein